MHKITLHFTVGGQVILQFQIHSFTLSCENHSGPSH